MRALYILNILSAFLTLQCFFSLSFNFAHGVFLCTDIFRFYVVKSGLVNSLVSLNLQFQSLGLALSVF